MRCKNEGFRFLWIQKQVSLTLNLQGFKVFKVASLLGFQVTLPHNLSI